MKLFDGLMYRHIKRDELTETERTYLENHVLITSALSRCCPRLVAHGSSPFGLSDEVKVAGKTLKSHWKSALR